MAPSPHSKWPQSGSCRSLGSVPVRVPSRWTGYTTYRISGFSTVPVMEETLRFRGCRDVTFQPKQSAKVQPGRSVLICMLCL